MGRLGAAAFGVVAGLNPEDTVRKEKCFRYELEYELRT